MPWLTPNVPTPTEYICRRLRIPRDVDLIAAFNGALALLTRESNWEAFGSQTPAETAEICQAVFLDYLESNVCLVGIIIPYASAQPPNEDILECNGSAYLRADYPTLYEKLDPAFIIDANSFSVPDLRGRTVIGAGTGIGLSTRTPGETGGSESVILATSQMPVHSHTTQPHTHGNAPHVHEESATAITLVSELPDPVFPAAIGVFGITAPAAVVIDPAIVTIDQAGDDQPHQNMQPFLALKYGIIAR